MPRFTPIQLRLGVETLRQVANELTARAMTSPTIANEISACDAIATFAQWAIGMVSVGLKAFAVVNATYR